MYIVAQNRKSVVNLDVFAGLAIIDGKIWAKWTDGSGKGIVVGAYTEDRANEVFHNILDLVFPATENKYENGRFKEVGKVLYFYMPEE